MGGVCVLPRLSLRQRNYILWADPEGGKGSGPQGKSEIAAGFLRNACTPLIQTV